MVGVCSGRFIKHIVVIWRFGIHERQAFMEVADDAPTMRDILSKLIESFVAEGRASLRDASSGSCNWNRAAAEREVE